MSKISFNEEIAEGILKLKEKDLQALKRFHRTGPTPFDDLGEGRPVAAKCQSVSLFG
jgi:hypothetical protein